MKQIYFIIIGLFLLSTVNAQAPDFAWARQLAGNGATSLTIDADGNSYITGTYNNTISIGGILLPHTGQGSNQFIVKFRNDGTPVWAKKFTGIAVYDDINPDKIIVDAIGNVYLSTVFYTGATINGVALPTPLQGKDYFVAKFDSLGNTEWIKTTQLADNIYNKIYNAIHLNSDGNICMTGLFNTSISFDANHVLTNTDNTEGVDGFVVTYDAGGNVVQAVRLGVVNSSFSGTYPEEIFKMDIHDNIYRLVPAQKMVVKYGSTGNVLMAKQLTATGGILQLTSMAPDTYGNVFFGGYFNSGTLVLEGTSIPSFGSANNPDALLLKLDGSGNMQWVKHYQAAVSDSYKQIRTDDIGNVYAVGQHADPGEVRSLMIKYSNAGNLLWEKVIIPGAGTPAGWVQANNIVQARNGGNILVLGIFKERIYFDIGTAFTSPGVYNIFLAQYGVCDTPVPTITASGPTVFCAGDSVLLTASPASNYVWNTGDTVQGIYVSQAGSYYVSAIEGAECYGRSISVQVTSVPFPADSVIQTGATLIAAESNATYQWIDCITQAPISGATAQSFSPLQNGNYAVEIINSAGCISTSNCYTISGLGIYEDVLPSVIVLYPNPATDVLHLSSVEQLGLVSIVNMVGQQVKAGVNLKDIDISRFSAGTYLIFVQTERGIWRSSFVKR